MVQKRIGLSRDLIIHPGETIADVLAERGITQAELAIRTGVTPTYVSNVINGKKDISARFAMALEYALGVRKTFWLNLQANYAAELLEFHERETITEEEFESRTHLDEIVNFLRSRDLMMTGENEKDTIISLRNALNISDISNLKRIALSNVAGLSACADVNLTVLGAWIRMCHVIGEQTELKNKYDKERIPDLIVDLKGIMISHESSIEGRLKNCMSEYGINLQLLRGFKGVPAYGYAYLRQDESYQLALTVRRPFADEFWYSLFHELGHIVNGDVSKNNRFVDTGADSTAEAAANEFASNALLEAASYTDFICRGDYGLKSIEEYSEEQNVMPYIVISRLKSEKRIDWNKYCEHMLSYQWQL